MARNTKSDDDWRNTVRGAAEGKPADKPATDPKPNTVTLSARVPVDLHNDLDELRVKLKRQRGEKVLMAKLVEEAIKDLLKKYK